MLRNTYKYVFFRIYQWNKIQWKNKEMAAFNSTLAITLSNVVLIFLLKLGIEYYFQIVLNFPFNNVYTSVGLVTIIFLLHYILFEKNKKYLKIESKYLESKGNKKEWIIKGILVFIYTIGPIIGCLIWL